jgi:hypothetical protein
MLIRSAVLCLALALFAGVPPAAAQEAAADRQTAADHTPTAVNRKLEVPAQLGSALVVSGAATLGSMALWHFGQRPVLAGLLVTTPPFTTAAMVDGVGRWYGDQGRYRGALLGSLGGAALGASLGGLGVFAHVLSHAGDDEDLSRMQLLLAIGVPMAVCSAGISVLGYNASARRQRRLLARKPMALDGGVGPLEGGVMLSLGGRF